MGHKQKYVYREYKPSRYAAVAPRVSAVWNDAPSSNAMIERDRRAQLRPRSITAAICGDPLPGYSALDRMARPT